MSRSKATEDEKVTVETVEEVKIATVVQQQEVQMSVSSTSSTGPNLTKVPNVNGKKKMGLEYFLQLNPQPYEITQLLRSLYKKSVMTYDEWIKTLEALLASKVTN